MTKIELEDYKSEIIKEISNIQEIATLNAIKRVLIKAGKKESTVISKDPLITKKIDLRCCYTEEELKNHIADALKSYQEGKYTIDKIAKPIVRWAATAESDVQAIKEATSSINKYETLIRKAIEVICYNNKAGKKEPLLSDIFDSQIRCISVYKHCRIFYAIIGENIVILALQHDPITVKS